MYVCMRGRAGWRVGRNAVSITPTLAHQAHQLLSRNPWAPRLTLRILTEGKVYSLSRARSPTSQVITLNLPSLNSQSQLQSVSAYSGGSILYSPCCNQPKCICSYHRLSLPEHSTAENLPNERQKIQNASAYISKFPLQFNLCIPSHPALSHIRSQPGWCHLPLPSCSGANLQTGWDLPNILHWHMALKNRCFPICISTHLLPDPPAPAFCHCIHTLM